MPDKPTAEYLIAEARRLDAEATPGPWEHLTRCVAGQTPADDYSVPVVKAEPYEVAEYLESKDAHYSAAARALLPALADELEAALARERSVQATNETLARDIAETDRLREQLGNADVWAAAVGKVLANRAAELAAEREAHAVTAGQRDSYLEQAKAIYEDGEVQYRRRLDARGEQDAERTAHAATKARLDAVTEAARKAQRAFFADLHTADDPTCYAMANLRDVIA